MEKTITIRQYLESLAQGYNNLGSEFNNYSPKNELYTGYARMCYKMLHDLSDYTLELPVTFRRFNYCGECRHYNKFHHACRDDLGREIKIMVFDNTEACEYFESLHNCDAETDT